MNDSIAHRLPQVVSRAYIFDNENKILLIKQEDDGMKWEVPYGTVAFGENVLDTAKRKAMEYTGVKVHPIGTLAVREGIKTNEEASKQQHSIFFDVICLGIDNQVDGPDSERCKWFTLDEAVKSIEQDEVKTMINYCAEKNRLGETDILATAVN
jgi:ADP-ribose pyrophosphatase YjhB (NUDIX family)